MNNSKILKARQFKKNEALNQIRKIYNLKYKFPYSQDYCDDSYDIPSNSEEREKYISNIIEQLERDLSNLKYNHAKKLKI